MTEFSNPSVEHTSDQRLSLCMIVKDEAHFLARCLNSVKDYVDEIIVVDTGSADDTRTIASRFTDRVYDFTWVDDFAVARNYSVEQASGDWILVLDADELISEEDLQLIRETIRNTTRLAFFLVQYNYMSNPLVPGWLPITNKTRFSGNYPGYQPNPIGRLFRNGNGICFQGAVHETIDQSLKASSHAALDVVVHHHMESDPSKPLKVRQLNYLRMIEKALAREPDGRLAASAGTVNMYFKEDHLAAIRYFRQAIDLGYEVDQNTECLAEACYRQGAFDEAREIYLKLYESGYTTLTLLTNLANLLVRNKEYRKAVSLLELALSNHVFSDDVEARVRHNIRHLESKLDSV